eukprot:jgi/Botrbrau1/13589/Bobra.0307s0008.1
MPTNVACESLSSLIIKQMGTTQQLYSDNDAIRWVLQITTELNALHTSTPVAIYRHLEASSVLLSSLQYNVADASLVKSGERQRALVRRGSDGGISAPLSGTTTPTPAPAVLSRKSLAAALSRASLPILPGHSSRKLSKGGYGNENFGSFGRHSSVSPTTPSRGSGALSLIRRSISVGRRDSLDVDQGFGQTTSAGPAASRGSGALSLLKRSISVGRNSRGSLDLDEIARRGNSFTPAGDKFGSPGPDVRRHNAEFLSNTISGEDLRRRRAVVEDPASKDLPSLSDAQNVLSLMRANDASITSAVSILDAISEQASLRAPIPRSVFAELRASTFAARGQTLGTPGDASTAEDASAPSTSGGPTEESGGTSAGARARGNALGSRPSSGDLQPPSGQQFLSAVEEPISAMYMPPEVFKKERHDVKADIFALGLLMNELFSRDLRSVRINGAEDTMERRKAYARDMAYGYRPMMGTNVPSRLVDLIKHCWDADPEDRPTAAEVIDALNEVMGDMNYQI